MEWINCLKFKRFEVRTPFFDPNPDKTTTNNHEWRQGLFMVFEWIGDEEKREFYYMPKWEEVQELVKKSKEVEQKNKELCISSNS